LELEERKRGWEELEDHGTIFQLATNSPKGSGEYTSMIKCHGVPQQDFRSFFESGVRVVLLDESRFIEKLEALQDAFRIPVGPPQSKSYVQTLTVGTAQ
jgi:hypothetical protein